MKTLLLTSGDIQNFTKILYDPSTVQVTLDDSSSRQTSGRDVMALQRCLNQPNAYSIAPRSQSQEQLQHSGESPQSAAVAFTQTYQQLLTQSTSQPKLQHLKQPSTHQQHTSFHHHPYYPQSSSSVAVAAPAHIHHKPANTQTYHNYNHNNTFPVHALNQNSNFSAASSSTGGGTTSSHAPTQQSNTTNSSLTPPTNVRSAQVDTAVKDGSSVVRSRSSSTNNGGTKKLKTEPVLSQFHQTERLTFANTHIVWDEEQWKRVVFQDERKFNLDGPDGFSNYFHDLRNYERTLSQRPRGNSVYIYLLITAGGPIHLEVSTSKQRPEAYVETILRERTNIVAKLGGNIDFVLQDHNWPANALPTTQEWLNTEGVKTQKWPTIAHDLNIMENVWGWLSREVYDGGRKFSRKDDLIFRIREAWTRIPIDLIANLYSTLPERITELYYTRGIYTNC